MDGGTQIFVYIVNRELWMIPMTPMVAVAVELVLALVRAPVSDLAPVQAQLELSTVELGLFLAGQSRSYISNCPSVIVVCLSVSNIKLSASFVRMASC